MSDVTVKIKIKPFTVPRTVYMDLPPRPKQEGMTVPQHYFVKDLDAETLSQLCDEFRKSIFELAEKTDPKGK